MVVESFKEFCKSDIEVHKHLQACVDKAVRPSELTDIQYGRSYTCQMCWHTRLPTWRHRDNCLPHLCHHSMHLHLWVYSSVLAPLQFCYYCYTVRLLSQAELSAALLLPPGSRCQTWRQLLTHGHFLNIGERLTCLIRHLGLHVAKPIHHDPSTSKIMTIWCFIN